jgi:hypothetical protein
VQVILTNDGSSINIRYIARVTDPTQFDVAFVEALAVRRQLQAPLTQRPFLIQ